MPKVSQTGYVILGALSIQSNLSGYDLRKGVQQSVGFFWGESYGQIYPSLKRLTAAKLIEPVKTKTAGRKRQEYAITEAGRTELRRWLALPFHNDPPRNEFLLKLFFGQQAAPGVALAHVRDVQERNRRMLETLEKIEASVPKDGPPNPSMPYWLLTLSLGKALTVAALEWGEGAIKMLAAQETAEKTPKQGSPTTKRKQGGRSTGRA